MVPPSQMNRGADRRFQSDRSVIQMAPKSRSLRIRRRWERGRKRRPRVRAAKSMHARRRWVPFRRAKANRQEVVQDRVADSSWYRVSLNWNCSRTCRGREVHAEQLALRLRRPRWARRQRWRREQSRGRRRAADVHVHLRSGDAHARHADRLDRRVRPEREQRERGELLRQGPYGAASLRISFRSKGRTPHPGVPARPSTKRTDAQIPFLPYSARRAGSRTWEPQRPAKANPVRAATFGLPRFVASEGRERELNATTGVAVHRETLRIAALGYASTPSLRSDSISPSARPRSPRSTSSLCSPR